MLGNPMGEFSFFKIQNACKNCRPVGKDFPIEITKSLSQKSAVFFRQSILNCLMME